jgi:hypothetical protein
MKNSHKKKKEVTKINSKKESNEKKKIKNNK